MNDSPTSPVSDALVESRPHTPASLEPLLRWKNDLEIQRLSDDEIHLQPRTGRRDAGAVDAAE
ncbi:hypothetical protein ACR6C2_38055 [Streptomyces sp. INA 01156]